MDRYDGQRLNVWNPSPPGNGCVGRSELLQWIDPLSGRSMQPKPTYWSFLWEVFSNWTVGWWWCMRGVCYLNTMSNDVLYCICCCMYNYVFMFYLDCICLRFYSSIFWAAYLLYVRRSWKYVTMNAPVHVYTSSYRLWIIVRRDSMVYFAYLYVLNMCMPRIVFHKEALLQQPPKSETNFTVCPNSWLRNVYT